MRESAPYSTSDNSTLRTTRDHLAALLRAPFRGGTVETEPLREAVCVYVDAARERGEPVERVIIDLKRMMELSGGWRRSTSRKEEAVAEGVIRWCIDRYYERSNRREVERPPSQPRNHLP